MKQFYKIFTKYSVVTKILITCLSLGAGVAIYYHGAKKLEEFSEKKFYVAANNYVNDINANLDKYNKIVLSIKALVFANPDISLTYFNDFVSSLHLDKFYPAFSSFHFVSYTTKDNYNKSIQKIVQDLNYYQEQSQDNEINFEQINNIRKQKIDNTFDNSLYLITLVQPVEANVNLLGTPFHNYAEVSSYFSGSQSDDIDSIILPIIKGNKYIGFLNTNINSKQIIKSTLAESKNLNYKVDTPDNLVALTNIVSEKYIYPATIKRDNKEFDILLYPENLELYNSGLDKLFLLLLSFLSSIVSLGVLNFIAGLILAKRKAQTQAQNMTKDLEKMAWYDSLTDLYNRAYFLQSVEKKIKNKKGEKFTLYFIDLDGFKRVNDTLGHHAGDQVLKEYADRLKQAMQTQEEIEIARVGGDEFVLFVDNQKDVDGWINKIKKATLNTFVVENHKFTLSQSIGVAFYPETGQDVETLLRKADMAMYIAKKSDSYDYVIYSEKVGQELVERNKMEGHLRESITGGELYLLFQPKIKVCDDGYSIAGFEALMRWNSPIWGEVGPDKFISIAEQNGFIDEMTKWLLRESCKTVRYFKEKLNVNFPVSINLSGRQFTNLNLAQEFLEIIKQEGVDEKDLLLEITESTIMKQPEKAKQIIEIYRKNNLKIALDDFGTGYSSFAYLSKFIVDEIKIDKSFIDNITKNESDKALVEAIILMSHRLKLRVIAEGIENLEQVRYLKSIGCDYFQGFHFSRPLYAHQIEKFYLSLQEIYEKDNK